jgi:FlgN protein
MTMTATDRRLGEQVLAHLDVQLDSGRRLLAEVLAQGAAIRARDVEEVLTRLSAIQQEMGARARLEQGRRALLIEAGARLSMAAGEVTVERLVTVLDADQADAVRHRSAELRGLLDEVVREHGLNRVLMRQELAFVSHLTQVIHGEPDAGYARPSANGTATAHRPPRTVLDLEA